MRIKNKKSLYPIIYNNLTRDFFSFTIYHWKVFFVANFFDSLSAEPISEKCA